MSSGFYIPGDICIEVSLILEHLSQIILIATIGRQIITGYPQNYLLRFERLCDKYRATVAKVFMCVSHGVIYT